MTRVANSPRSSSRIARRPQRCWTSDASKQLSSGRERGAGIRVVVGDTRDSRTLPISLRADSLRRRVPRQPSPAMVEAAFEKSHLERSAIIRVERRYCPRRRQGPQDRTDEHADDAARSEGSSITQVQVALGDSTRHFVVANSDGLFPATPGAHPIHVSCSRKVIPECRPAIDRSPEPEDSNC